MLQRRHYTAIAEVIAKKQGLFKAEVVAIVSDVLNEAFENFDENKFRDACFGRKPEPRKRASTKSKSVENASIE